MLAYAGIGFRFVRSSRLRDPCGARFHFQEVLTIANKSLKELREALIQKALGKRSNITVCVHGINKYYCTYCKQPKVKVPKEPKAPKAAKTPKAPKNAPAPEVPPDAASDTTAQA